MLNPAMDKLFLFGAYSHLIFITILNNYLISIQFFQNSFSVLHILILSGKQFHSLIPLTTDTQWHIILILGLVKNVFPS